MTPLAFTVILLNPSYIEADDAYSNTFQAHVYGAHAEEAIHNARYLARAAMYSLDADTDLPDVNDWGFIAVFLGHLENQYTP